MRRCCCLRGVPYIGRMGTLLETDSGTGLVRRLIWAGDDKAGGAIGLISSTRCARWKSKLGPRKHVRGLQ